MKIQSTLLSLLVLFMLSCGKDNDEPIVEPDPEPEPELVGDPSAISYFHDAAAYYQPYVYRYDDESQTWGKRIGAHFSTISETDTTYLGFTNPYVADSGVNLFQMVTLYQEYTGTTNVKTAAINVDQVLRFLPDETSSFIADDSKVRSKGTVEIYAQKVKIYKNQEEGATERTYIEIGISGSGTYDLTTGVADIEVHFDESAVGGQSDVVRKYKMSKTALEL